MTFLQIMKDNLYQIYALIVRDIELQLRFKYTIIFSFISPIIYIFMPIIIMSQFFELNVRFGPWTQENYLIYQFIAYNIYLLINIINQFASQLFQEKFWNTLPALIIAPFNKLNLLFGIFFSHLILISLPFVFFIIMSYLIYPPTFFVVLTIIGLYLLIALIFSGIGLIMGVFAVSNENLLTLMNFLLNIIFILSSITYPFEIFPEAIQNIISLNPFYYIFDILRLVWIENDVLKSFMTHSFHFYNLIILATLSPIIGVYFFNFFYKKYGIQGK